MDAIPIGIFATVQSGADAGVQRKDVDAQRFHEVFDALIAFGIAVGDFFPIWILRNQYGSAAVYSQGQELAQIAQSTVNSLRCDGGRDLLNFGGGAALMRGR